jgi:drug/metabolite transporter (DMT)-like permease
MGFNEKSYKGHLLMVLAYTVFGLNIPAVKSIVGTAGITGLSVTFYRMAGAAALFWIASVFARRQHVPLRDVGWICLASLFCIVINQMPFISGYR